MREQDDIKHHQVLHSILKYLNIFLLILCFHLY